jgi:hypothetical protein
MPAWQHNKSWTNDYYNKYRAYVAKVAPTLAGPHKNSRGEDLDCADLSIRLIIDFAAANGLPLNFLDVSGFIYTSKARWPFGPNDQQRPSQVFANKELFTIFVRQNIQTKSLWNLNTDVNPDGPSAGDLLMRYSEGASGMADNHHTALIFAAYAPGVAHPKAKSDTPSFPGPDEAMSQVRVTEYFMGTVDDDFVTKSRAPDAQTHFDYLNSRGNAKRNAELVYFANAAQFLKIGFEFRKYSDFVLFDWPNWDGEGRPPLFDQDKIILPKLHAHAQKRAKLTPGARPTGTGVGRA